MKKIINIFLFLGVIGGPLGFYFFDNFGSDRNKNNADNTFTAAELVKAFKDDETAANKQYLNKAIQVSGVVKYVNTVNGAQNIIIETGDLISSITCEMSKSAKSIKNGDEVDIKGYFAGYLLDVVLTKCVVQNKKN